MSAVKVLNKRKVAFLSDEIGSIFLFNLESGAVEKQVQFGPPGDYEGLVIINTTAYIACADGRILEVKDFAADSISVIEHGTHLTVADHLSGLCYDRRNKRLLVTVRGMEDGAEPFKPIYAFQLADKRMLVKPALRIDLTSMVFSNLQPRRVQTIFQPSDIDINPTTGSVYVIDGNRSQLLRMKLSESIRDLTEFDKEKINQPEGVSFTPSGDIFIASKGLRDEPGILLQIRIK